MPKIALEAPYMRARWLRYLLCHQDALWIIFLVQGKGELEQAQSKVVTFFQMHSCLQKALSQVRELSQEIDDYRGGAMRKQQEKEVREVYIPTNIAFVIGIHATAVQLNKTLSYVKKHMFNLFKSTGQERVREYMKEVTLVVAWWKLSLLPLPHRFLRGTGSVNHQCHWHQEQIRLCPQRNSRFAPVPLD